jgi:hypothetical protein
MGYTITYKALEGSFSLSVKTIDEARKIEHTCENHCYTAIKITEESTNRLIEVY